jgi:PAS domain S-box-containing protein
MLSGALIDQLPLFVVVLEKSGAVSFMNRTLLRQLGYELGEVIGKDYISTFVPEQDRGPLLALLHGALDDQQVDTHENSITRKDGETLIIEWHCSVILGEDGSKEGFVALGVDITEQRRFQDALRQSEQKLQVHMQRTPLGVIEWTPDLRVVDWNASAERLFGYTKGEMLGRSGEILLTESVRPVVRQVVEALNRNEGGLRSTNENITKGGTTIICDWYNTPLVDEDGRVIGIASLVSDITEQVKTTEALRRSEEELRRTEREQAELIEQLSAPIIDVWEGVLALPVVGPIDEARAARMMEALLEAVSRTRARVAIIDLTGVMNVDVTAANSLVKIAQAVRLLGALCLLSGISPAIARTLAELSADTGELLTFGSLSAALGFALRATRGHAR